MEFAVSALAFVATVGVVMALMYALSPVQSAVADRLTRLWHFPGTAPKPKVSVVDAQSERLQRVLAQIGSAIPSSPKQLSRLQKMMLRAGYRSSESVMAMRGIKLLFPALLLAIVYFARLYQTIGPFVIIIALAIGYIVPEFWLGHKVQRRQHRLRRGLPDALDLLVICVEAGLGMDQALLRVSQELHTAHPDLSEEFQLVNLEMRVGKTRLEALRGLADRTGVEDVKALVAMLVQTDRFGTSVAQSLRVHSDDLRTKRRQRAEEMAAKTTVKMVPPLVFLIFPALMVVILGPAVIEVIRQLLPILRR